MISVYDFGDMKHTLDAHVMMYSETWGWVRGEGGRSEAMLNLVGQQVCFETSV